MTFNVIGQMANSGISAAVGGGHWDQSLVVKTAEALSGPQPIHVAGDTIHYFVQNPSGGWTRYDEEPPVDPYSNPGTYGVSQALWSSPVYFDYVEEGYDDWMTENWHFSDVQMYANTSDGMQALSQQVARPSGLNMPNYGFDPTGASSGPSNVGDMMNFYGSLDDPDYRADLNQALYRAGFVDGDPDEAMPIGGWSMPDMRYVNGWADAVQLASINRVPVMELLRIRSATFEDRMAGRDDSSGPQRIRPTVQLISDDDAARLIDEVGRRELGRTLTPSEMGLVNAAIDSMQSQQRSEQNALYDQQMAGGGEAINPTSAETLAYNEVRERKSSEAASYRFLGNYMNLLRTGAP